MPPPSIKTARGWRDKPMVDRGGAPLGRIVHIYLDRVSGQPAWAMVTSGQEDRLVFVPLVDAAERQDQIGVPVQRALVADAPPIRPGRKLSKKDTARLHGHYGGAPERRWGSARRMPAGGPPIRLRQGLDWARERAASLPGIGFPHRRRLLGAGVAVASVAGGLVLVRRRRRARPSGLAAAVLKLLAGLAAGYVLGARAGRERYERIAQATRRLAERPEVRELTGKVRAGLGAGLEKAAGTASDRLQQVRGEDRGGTRSPQSEAGEADESGREGGGSSPEPGPSRGRRERSRSGR